MSGLGFQNPWGFAASRTLWPFVVMLAALLSWLRHEQTSIVQQQEQQLHAMASELAVSNAGRARAAERAASETAGSDFVIVLPEVAPVDAWIQAAQRASSAHGVRLGGLAVNPRAGAVATVGRTEVQLQWQGTYPAIKAALNEALDARQAAVLARLSLRKAPVAPGMVDAQIEVWVLARPNVASAVAGR